MESIAASLYLPLKAIPKSEIGFCHSLADMRASVVAGVRAHEWECLGTNGSMCAGTRVDVLGSVCKTRQINDRNHEMYLQQCLSRGNYLLLSVSLPWRFIKTYVRVPQTFFKSC